VASAAARCSAAERSFDYKSFGFIARMLFGFVEKPLKGSSRQGCHHKPAGLTSLFNKPMLLQHLLEVGFVDDFDAQLFRFLDLAPRFRSSQNIIRVLAHPAADMTAQTFDPGGGFLPRQ
jgi:hypothetical protein